MNRRIANLAASAVLLGCGYTASQKQSRPHAPTLVQSSASPAPASPEPSVAFAQPSNELIARWVQPHEVDALAYGNFGALIRSEILMSLMPSVMQMVENQLSTQAKDCIGQWLLAVRELGVIVGNGKGLIIITYDPKVLATPVNECMKHFGTWPEVALPRANIAYSNGKEVVAIHERAILFGDRTMVEESLSKEHRDALPPNLRLGKYQRLVFSGKNREEEIQVDGYLSVKPEGLLVQANVTFADSDKANAAAEFVAPQRLVEQLRANGPDTEPLAKLVTECWHISLQDKTVGFEFRLFGKPEAIAYRIGFASALAINGVRQYIIAAKTKEARTTVATIAKRIIATSPRRLVTLPPVPARFEAIQGQKYQSAKVDWNDWKTIDFSLTEPQYYQYRVDVAKDGHSAQIVAEGDLDSDGNHSRISLGIKQDSKTKVWVVDPSLVELTPNE